MARILPQYQEFYQFFGIFLHFWSPKCLCSKKISGLLQWKSAHSDGASKGLHAICVFYRFFFCVSFALICVFLQHVFLRVYAASPPPLLCSIQPSVCQFSNTHHLPTQSHVQSAVVCVTKPSPILFLLHCCSYFHLRVYLFVLVHP